MSNEDIKILIDQNLHFVQKNLNAPKNRRNSFGNYSYRNCEDILEAVKKVMPEGCVVGLSDEVLHIGERYYVKATASFCFGGRAIVVSAMAREQLEKKGMDASQITLAASSYARKTALNGLFAIDDSKDNDEEAKKPEPIAKVETVFLTKDQVFKLSEMIFKAKIDAKEIYKKYNVKSYDQLSSAQANEIANECKLKYASV